jgi:hypothetical protein
MADQTRHSPDVQKDWAEGTNGVTTPNPVPVRHFEAPGRAHPDRRRNVNFSSSTGPVEQTRRRFCFHRERQHLVSQNLNQAYTWGSTAQMVAELQGWLDGH